MRDFSINGRFYSQPTTGVQRYGREIVLAMDTLLDGNGRRGSIILPSNARDVPALSGFDLVPTKRTTGHLWEQTALPWHAERPTLNLCNTGPLAAGRQTVCIHDAHVFTAPDSYSLSFRLLYRSLLPQLAKRGVRITSVSNFSRDAIAKHLCVPSTSIAVIPNGHEHVFRWNAAASTLDTKLSGIRPYVLLLGSNVQHKNIGFILAQAGDLDALGLDLVVVGGGASIFAAIESIDRPNIHRLGFVSDDDLAYLYGHALCLAFPSRAEGFGIPVVEAMALGCPVVAADRTSLPEVCGQAALMGDPDDAAAWRRHFVSLKESKQLRADLRGQGREQAKKFSWLESARAYLDLVGHAS